MPLSPSSSVQEARKAIAQRLREARLDAGLTGHELSRRCGWHPAKTSRIENARAAPTDADIRSWCTACGAPDRIADLIAASRSADSMYVEWRRLHRGGLRGIQESYAPLYERTSAFRIYCSNVMPGVLQTPEYAAALMGVIADFQGAEADDSADAAAARVERSQVIRRGHRRFALLVEEAVLRYRVGDAATMAGQLGHLLSAMVLPSVSLGVIPFTAQRRIWPQETFSIFDEECVEVELLTARVMVTSPTDLQQYVRAFADLSALAVHGAEARELITAALHSLG
ncbi:helix-turn-helix domain-containing protein [Streptomyces hoynatensis]|uniref:XRE family transcriptional regulator n=1 Tax=Streptomyces hoynatensis TaxID=1141874 RepID=A0A3A9YUE7_9ACTN|nr:helix-turn-helix transcriptional regulator [Streptomyces hoynatensis]RKN39731.1 XRE family transcriptional regulator [Streptomyces hoynatensis]